MKKAFTLAEVLITLVIIGVVAALTIPNLMQKYTEQTTVKKVQKFYSNLSNAYNLAMKDNGTSAEWGLTGWDEASAVKIYEMLFKPYFKIAKDCGIDNKGNCLANVRYKLITNGNSVDYYSATPANGAKYYKIALDDGSVVWWRGGDDKDSGPNPHTGDISIAYDVNGPKEPNQWGKDTFEFFIKNDKAAPSGTQTGDYSMRPFNSYCRNYGGWGCAAWIIYKGNMDYLHCDGLTWASNSCKDK